MLSFLKSVFGSDITEAEYHYVDDTPNSLRRRQPLPIKWLQEHSSSFCIYTITRVQSL